MTLIRLLNYMILAMSVLLGNLPSHSYNMNHCYYHVFLIKQQDVVQMHGYMKFVTCAQQAHVMNATLSCLFEVLSPYH